MKLRLFLILIGTILIQPLFAQWTNLNTNLPGTLTGVNFTTTTTGIVCGTSGIYFTTNGGTNWQRVNPTGPPADTNMYHFAHFKAIQYVTSSSSWVVVGSDTIQDKAVIFLVNASATSCALVYSGATNSDLLDVRQSGSYTIAVGDGGLGLSSGNGGSTWNSLQNFSSAIDLYSVATNGSAVYIVGNGVTYRNSNFPTNSWTVYTSTPTMNKIVYNGGIYGVGTFLQYSGNFGLTWTGTFAYNYGPLDGRSIFFRTSSDGSIATDHGVYRSVPSTSAWELQASSMNYNLYDLFFISGTGYAVGANGTVLKTTTNGDPALPYVNYSSQNGGCVDSTIQFSNLSPSVSGYTYRWKNSGVQFATSFNSSYTFTSTGTFPIRLIATHLAVMDSVTRNMPIVTLPDANKTISISDSILCKSGNTDITVHNSDAGIIYRLFRISPWAQIDQVIGTGGDVVLNTGTITDSTNYRIKAISPLADCGAYLPQNILIAVEKTKAKFHSTLINAELNEPVTFLNNSAQAAYADWTFTPNATPSNSTQLDATASFSNIGTTSITLIATSLYGCIDTVTGPGPYIFDNSDPGLNIPCWAINIDGSNPNAAESGQDLVADASGNLLVSGNYSQAIFTSRAGISYNAATASGGGFIANYNSNGVLRWLTLCTVNTSILTDVERAGDGSIYAAGYGTGIWMMSNAGDSVYIGDGTYVFHFDSLGGLTWYAGFPNQQTQRMAMKTDSAGNVYVAGNMSPTLFYSSISGSQTVGTSGARFYMARINANGTFGWMTNATNVSPYMTGVNDLAIDQTGHIYITGNYSADLTFNSVSSATALIPAAGQGCNVFYAKYTLNGDVVWAKQFGTILSGYTFDYGLCVDADSSGNIYLSGEVDAYYTPQYVEFPTSTGVVQVQIGQLFYAAFDSSGAFRWAGGTKYANNGRSQVVTVGKNNNVLGSAWLANGTSANFVSNNNTYTTMPVNQGSFYFTSYDTAGVLQFVNTETGLTPLGQGPVTDCWGMDDDTAGNIYVTGGLRGFNGNPYYPIADTTLTLNNQDVFIAKISGACIDTNTFTSVITSSYNVTSENTLFVFPNPSSGQFVIRCSVNMDRVIITNTLGQEVHNSSPASSEVMLKLNSAGVYYATIWIDQQQIVREIIVEK